MSRLRCTRCHRHPGPPGRRLPTPCRVIEQCDDAVTLSGAPMLAAAYRATLLGIRARRADGLPAGDLLELARALRRAHARRASDMNSCQVAATRHDETVRTARLGQRRRGSRPPTLSGVRFSGSQPPRRVDGIRVGRAWMLAKAPVLTWQRGVTGDRTNGLSV